MFWFRNEETCSEKGLDCLKVTASETGPGVEPALESLQALALSTTLEQTQGLHRAGGWREA